MARRRLPIGIQSFRKMRESNCYYVDKTGYALRLAAEGGNHLLSRPRRFGKSLFLDTLKELFEGSKELFDGLQAYQNWDWSVTYPVIKLSFGKGSFNQSGYVHTNLMAQLDGIEEAFRLESRYDTAPERFARVIESLHRQTNQRVVVLVDEYDKPILDALERPDTARENREYLRGLYAVVKDCDSHVHFCFLTGVSKFSQVSLFSGLDNLLDITLDPTYSALCGYTEFDLDTVFGPELQGLDRELIREWYNGYGWGGQERVYNPFDVLLLLRRREFKAWWFETGTPSFLVETLVRQGIPASDLDGKLATDEALATFDVGEIAPEALLFQTGYLTLVGERWIDGRQYRRLGYPNREVRQSLNLSIRNYLSGNDPNREAHSRRLGELLRAADFAGLEQLLRAVFAGIPYEWHTRNEIARYEGYYASVLYSYLAGLGPELDVEESSGAGRLDMAVWSGNTVYLFEFKVLERSGAGAAMAQLKERGYADKYRHQTEKVYLVAVEFSEKERNIASLEAELV